MKVLVDTSVWSLAFRKKPVTEIDIKIVTELIELIRDLRVVLIGPIRQEILSGISDSAKYSILQQKMAAFVDHPIETADYELAAKLSNDCRIKGIQGSHIDFLICAFAVRNELAIFTTDQDFKNYSKIIPIELLDIK